MSVWQYVFFFIIIAYKMLPKLAMWLLDTDGASTRMGSLFCMLLDMPWSSGMDPSFITYGQHNVETKKVIFCYCYLLDSVIQACGFVLLPHFADSLVGGSENTVSDMFIYVPHLGRHCDKQQGCIFSSRLSALLVSSLLWGGWVYCIFSYIWMPNNPTAH